MPLPAEDLPLPSEWLSEQDSAATSGLLYVVDLLAQFPQVFKVRSVPRKEMLALLEGACSARGNERPADSLWDLYHDLLTLALQVRVVGGLVWKQRHDAVDSLLVRVAIIALTVPFPTLLQWEAIEPGSWDT